MLSTNYTNSGIKIRNDYPFTPAKATGYWELRQYFEKLQVGDPVVVPSSNRSGETTYKIETIEKIWKNGVFIIKGNQYDERGYGRGTTRNSIRPLRDNETLETIDAHNAEVAAKREQQRNEREQQRNERDQNAVASIVVDSTKRIETGFVDVVVFEMNVPNYDKIIVNLTAVPKMINDYETYKEVEGFEVRGTYVSKRGERIDSSTINQFNVRADANMIEAAAKNVYSWL